MAKARILFVDDEPGIRATLPAVLEMHDFETVTCASVGEALQVIQSQKFDVLLSDLNIGEAGDGFTVVSAMRRLQPTAVTIIITGFPAFETALEAIRSQVDDYIVKPTDAKRLVETIEEKMTGERRRVHRPMGTKRVCDILEENSGVIIRDWLEAVEKMPEIVAVELTENQRTDHIPQVLEETVRMLRAGKGPDTSRKAMKGASKHGVDRREQRYTIPMLLEEGRILRRVICAVIQQNILAIEISTLISDLIQVEDNVSAQTNESVRAYLQGKAKSPRAA
jgi:YesN/AraC family two-component response regulator